MKTRFDFVGLEFDWFVKDAEGCVALFSSAGWGPIPNFVFEHFDGQRAIEQQLHIFINRELVEPSSIDPNSLPAYFDALVEHGVFCFDWENTFGPYKSHATLSKTLFVSQLDISAELESSFVVLPDCHFSLCPELDENLIPSFTDVRRR